MSNRLVERARTISRFAKLRYLLAMPEARFPDEVIRPLFIRRGLRDGSDQVGQSTDGSHAFFLATDPLGPTNVYVVHTRRGNINLSGKHSHNLATVQTHIRAALDTAVILSTTKEKRYPAKVILCSSGTISEGARRHIIDEIRDSRIEFMDADDLIPAIDATFPELWFGIDAQLSPYLRSLRRVLEEASEDLAIIATGRKAKSAIADDMFVSLVVTRITFKPIKKRGKVERMPRMEEMPVHGLLRRSERLILLLGTAGSGKSTALRRLAYLLAGAALDRTAAEGSAVPILLRALDISMTPSATLAEISAENSIRVGGAGRSAFAAGDLEAGRVVILVDALDEIPSDDLRRRVIQQIRQFSVQYPRCQVIIATRPTAFVEEEELLDAFTEFRLSEISYKQAELILRRVHASRGLEPEISQEILRQLQDVHGMELNPLLVTVFAATSDYARRDVPANITELFKKYTEMMLGRWDVSKGLAQQYQAPLKDFVLTQIAFEMHRRATTSIAVGEFGELVAKLLESRGYQTDIAELLDEMLHRSGLFRIADGFAEFRHLLLQEFFAGRGIGSQEFLEAVISDDWWKRAIVFYFGEHAGDSRGLLTLIRAVLARPLPEKYRAAQTIGLALQANYLAEVKDKVEILAWVIETFGAGKEEYVAHFRGEGHPPLIAFIYYYMSSRDSVASHIIGERVAELRARIQLVPDPKQREAQQFWLMAGLVEAGFCEKVGELLPGMRGGDPKYLLAIYLGCRFLTSLRVTTRVQQKAAKRIGDELANRLAMLRQELLREFRTELLEMRKGELRALGASTPSDETEPDRKV